MNQLLSAACFSFLGLVALWWFANFMVDIVDGIMEDYVETGTW
jgi:hypothetical protein